MQQYNKNKRSCMLPSATHNFLRKMSLKQNNKKVTL